MHISTQKTKSSRKPIFRMKASPGRGKLSPQVTDEGAPFTAACLYPSSVCSLGSQPPTPPFCRYATFSPGAGEICPQGVKALAPGQVAKIGFRATQKTKSCRRAPRRKFLRGATICPAEAYQSGETDRIWSHPLPENGKPEG